MDEVLAAVIQLYQSNNIKKTFQMPSYGPHWLTLKFFTFCVVNFKTIIVRWLNT